MLGYDDESEVIGQSVSIHSLRFFYFLSTIVRNRNIPIVVSCVTTRRVLKPGGRFLCLEFSHIPPSFGPLGKIYDAYSFAAIPALGQVS